MKLLLITIWISHLFFFARPYYKIVQFHDNDIKKSCITCIVFSNPHRSSRCVGPWSSNRFCINVYSFCKWSTTIFFCEDTCNRNHVFDKMNALILHSYKISCMYDLLLNHDFEDWVKARSTTYYSWFLMIQYDDKRWIKHFRLNKSFMK